MTPDATSERPRGFRSLSARLLVLTVAFVMGAEILIYAPSIARFRDEWLTQKLAAAHLGILALEAVPDSAVDEELKQAVLEHVGAYAIVLQKEDMRVLLAQSSLPTMDLQVTVGERNWLGLTWDAFDALLHGRRVIRLLGPSPRELGVRIEALIDEAPLHRAMLLYSRNVMLISVGISVFAATLVFLSLNWLLVRPMRRIADGVLRFAERPEDPAAGVRPSGRADEIGAAERVLVRMQDEVRAALRQQERLAALGAAIVKISHDLRGILATATLISDRLAAAEDPEVRRIAKPLLQAIERATALTASTLAYAREERPALALSRFAVAELLDEVRRDVVGAGAPTLAVEAGGEVEVEADRDQFYRVLANLARNAVEAGAKTVRVSARNGAEGVVIDVSDDGPGLSERARQSLFRPFSGSARKGGTGLGLAIAREVMRAHGGDIALVGSGADGTRFRLMLPAPAARRQSS